MARIFARAWQAFAASTYITALWNWFLMLAARAVQPVLFLTVMYSIAETYPGFKSPGPQVDLAAFLAQNVALDVGSFGLPKLADQAEAAGNEEAAQQARKVAKALFLILVTNLVWGGIEHIAGNQIADGWKVGIALVFTVIRAYYATEYMRVIHRLDAHDDALPQVQPSQPSVQSLQKEVQALVQVQLAEVQIALAQEVQSLVGEVQTALEGQVQKAVQLHSAKSQEQVQALVGEVQTALGHEVQRAVQSQVRQVQSALENAVQAHSAQLTMEVQEAVQAQRATLQMEVQALVQTPVSEVQGPKELDECNAPVRKNRTTHGEGEVQEPEELDECNAPDGPRTDALVLEMSECNAPGVAPAGGFKQAVFAYVEKRVALGYKPTIQDVIEQVGCKRRSAVEYRKAALLALKVEEPV